MSDNLHSDTANRGRDQADKLNQHARLTQTHTISICLSTLTRAALGTAGLMAALSSAVTAAEDSDPSETFTLTPLLVEGGPSQIGYHSTETTGALGMPADTRDVPQSVNIVPRETIEDTGERRVYEALDFVSGSSKQNDFGGIWDNVAIRGFEGDVNRGPVFLRDGVRANRGFTGRQDSINVERLEVLKGPASALFGRGDPGGTVNIVTKRPEFESRREVTAAVNSEQNYRGTVDVTGPISDSLAYRLSAAAEQGDTFRDKVDEGRFVLAPALTWHVSPDTRVHYDGEFSRQDRTFDRGIPAIDGKPGEIPISNFYGDPGEDVTTDNIATRLRVNHELNANWSAQVTFAHLYSSLEGFSAEHWNPGTLGAADDQLPRQRRFRDYGSHDLVGAAELRGWLTTGGIEHQLLAGVEISRFEQDWIQRRSEWGWAIDIMNPQYGEAPPEFDPSQRQDRETTEDTRALYLQNQMHLTPTLRVLLGGRLDRFEQTVRYAEAHQGGVDNTRITQTQTAFSPRAGITWDAHDTTTLFVSAARSFDPNSRVGDDPDSDDVTLDPETSDSIEIGSKSRFLNDRLAVDAALFHIRKENIPRDADPTVNHAVAAGEVESRGVELDINMNITESWRASMSYAYTDARDLADGEDVERDFRVRNVPRHKGSVLSRYDWNLTSGQDLSLIGGVIYVGSRPGAQHDRDFELPSYTTTRVRGVYSPLNDLELSVNVENLFDEEYYRSSWGHAWVAPGAPRTITAQVRYGF